MDMVEGYRIIRGFDGERGAAELIAALMEAHALPDGDDV